MKQIVAILLICSMLGQMFQGDFIILDYLTHRQKYAELCINKDKPEMNCNGACQMDKKIQDSQDQQAGIPESLPNRVSIVLYCIVDALHFNWANQTKDASKVVFQNSVYSLNVVAEHYRPPILS